MKIGDILLVESIARKLEQDPKESKMLALAFKHDITIPVAVIVSLGPNPSNEAIAAQWSTMVDKVMREDNEWGDISRDNSVQQWLIKSYSRGIINWEDLSGEAVDRLGKFYALSVRNLLRPDHTDLNRVGTLDQLNHLVGQYEKILRKIAVEAKLEQMKRQASSIVLIDNERFHVSIPLNYGACYMFNNKDGVTATYCTGSSGGRYWFERYSNQGPLIDVLDKAKSTTTMGKWQLHAATDQIKNANQSVNSDREFAKRFPGLLPEIARQMQARSAEIAAANAKWNAAKEADKLLKKFPLSAASEVGAPAEKGKKPAGRRSAG
jgi:hypothetical protein